MHAARLSWTGEDWVVVEPGVSRREARKRHEQRRHAEWMEALRRLMPAHPVDVLHAGADSRRLAYLLAEIGHRVVVVGQEEAAGFWAGAAAGETPRFQIGEPVSPPFGPSSFDVVASYGLIGGLMDPRHALESWWALLRPGGRLLAVDLLRCPPDGPIAALEALHLLRGVVERAGFAASRLVPLAGVDRVERPLDDGPGLIVRYALTAVRHAGRR